MSAFNPDTPNPYQQPPLDVPGVAAGAPPINEDWRPKAVAIMTAVGGGLALLMALINLVLAIAICVTIVGAFFSVVVGGLCLFKGITLLTKPMETQAPPLITAILQIASLISCDLVNVAFGITILIFINDPAVKAKFAPQGNAINF